MFLFSFLHSHAYVNDPIVSTNLKLSGRCHFRPRYLKLYRRFVDRRKRLSEHAIRMHEPRHLSGLTVYRLQGRLLHFAAEQQSAVRWRGVDLDRFTPNAMDEAYALLSELEGFSGLFLRTDPSQWTGAKLTNGAVVQQAIDSVRRLPFCVVRN